ncbi:MAG: hypothetical protein J3K34DRAFT_153963 [Monoraphidium minutum]|nr:MAG: hypothetical protein J3K34DRAFT_153963 [Monoraphidium minutum]
MYSQGSNGLGMGQGGGPPVLGPGFSLPPGAVILSGFPGTIDMAALGGMDLSQLNMMGGMQVMAAPPGMHLGGGGMGGGGGDESTQFYKTRLCHKWQEGKCNFGPTCKYAHGEGDLRPEAPARPGLKLAVLKYGSGGVARQLVSRQEIVKFVCARGGKALAELAERERGA